MNDCDKILRDIRLLKSNLKKISKNLPYLIGLYGEILVLKELQKRFSKDGARVDFGSGQTRADFTISNKINTLQPISVEVKSSTLKDEGSGFWYGFAINAKKCKKHKNKEDFCYFDYLILIPFKKELKLKQDFYIFPRKFIEKNEKELRNKSKRFKSATHRIIFLPKSYKNLENPSKEIKKIDLNLINGKIKFKNRWATLE